jgi:toxin ParE1/3/4
VGEAVADRYDLLLDTALQEIGDDLQLRGSRPIPGMPAIRTYPIRLSRAHVLPVHRIGKPRHLVVYRVADDGVVEVLGIVHDRMLLGRAARRLAERLGGSREESV